MSPLSSKRAATAAAALVVAVLFGLSVHVPRASAAGCPVPKATKGSNNEDHDDDRTLFIHMVPHTHDDVGWLKTVEQYYYGFNNTIQHASVKYILDTVTMALQQKPSRKFTYVEMAFFSKWWSEQTDDRKAKVRALVKNGQLSFANGGWCMHDEAATHFMGMIDQTTIGHAFLKDELGVVPKVGWQLDPFGHSATQASLLTSKMGFDAIYFGRIDHQDLKKRYSDRQCEGFWSASPSFGDDGKVFWGLTGSYSSYDSGYGSPKGFNFDSRADDDYLVGKDEAGLKERLVDFLGQMAVQANRTQGQHIMLTLGLDFLWSNAFVNYDNYDLLIESLMKFQTSGEIDIPSMIGPGYDRIEIFYSNPEIYTQCKHEDYRRLVSKSALSSSSLSSEEGKMNIHTTNGEGDHEPWDTKTDDFFPYSDCDHCYWTGYFTSRPAMKRLERVGSSFLHAARQIESYKEGTSPPAPDHPYPLRKLEEALGVAQHHDAVSGTSKQHVAYDYARRIQEGIDEAEEYVSTALREALLDDALVDYALKDLMYCQLLNVTKCKVSQDSTKSAGKDLYAIVYNALGGKRKTAFVSIPVSNDVEYAVEKLVGSEHRGAATAAAPPATAPTSTKWEPIPSALVPNANYSRVDGSAPFSLLFDAGIVPAAGAAVFRLRRRSGCSFPPASSSASEKDESVDGDLESLTSASPEPDDMGIEGKASTVVGSGSFDGQVGGMSSVSRRSLRANASGVANAAVDDSSLDEVISNGCIRVHFERGMMKRITSVDDTNGWDVEAMLEWGYYTSFNSKDKQNSGAYIFRPEEPDQHLKIIKPDPSKSHVFKSSLVTEVHVGFEVPWIKHIVRIRKVQPYVEVEYTVGPIPIDDGVGKEVVAQYNSAIKSDGVFYTDSNGREFMKRKRGFRPTWDLEEHEPVAGNFYPVNAAAFIEDDDDATTMAVLVDRSQGGASLTDGSIELMVHRRIVADDGRGVGEPMNETDIGMTPYPPYGNAERLGEGMIVTGVHRIVLGSGGATLARVFMDETWSPPHVFVASAPSSSNVLFQSPGFSGAGYDLPRNVMVITHSLVKSADEGSTFLVRLGHQYAEGEDEELSKPVRVDMRRFYSGYALLEAVETTLSGNQRLEEWQERRLVWDKGGGVVDPDRNLDDEWVWELKPMEIRTFLVQLTAP